MFSAKQHIIILLLLWSVWSFAHDHEAPFVKSRKPSQENTLKFEENLGQLPDHVAFRAYIPGGAVFLEGQTLTVNLLDIDEINQFSEFRHGLTDKAPEVFHGHAFKIHLQGSQTPTGIELGEAFEDIVNYYVGDDPTKWASGVKQYRSVTFKNVYPNIDVKYYALNQDFKYDFILHPGADVSNIKLAYEGVDALKIGFGNLLISTSIEEMIDKAPVSWALNGTNKQFVASRFTMREELGENVVGFEVDYDGTEKLIIDPTLIFSTYSGSTINNWGSTATYDSLGNMYAGGFVLSGGTTGAGYPVTTGAYQTTFGGGQGGLGTDMSITKFNADGDALLYSTYLGGAGNEIPHSLIVNDNNELYILGTTSSVNFPTSNNAFDNSFNGGSNINNFGPNSNSSSIIYTGGSDIVITKLNANGTNLLASTYIGGTENDGINLSDVLQKAYADEFRGEIIVDENDNCYVATSTMSTDFPTTNNAFQNTFGGGLTDGVIFKFNSNLSNLLWSSYIGGSSDDAAYSVQFDPNFDVFCTGGTMSTNFPTTNNALHPSYQGGVTDGWVAKISNNGQNLIASTYLGTTSYDQSFFVQLDLSGFVYVVGQTLGNYPIGPSWVYSVPNSGQFLHKLTNNLQSTVFSTRWGTGNGNINLSLTAFLVNECNHIFVSGWGGSLFGTGAPSSPGGTTTTGLPTTANAVQTTTDGHDFYFIVFEDSATSILFASFFGGTTGAAGGEHADGGTSRFDKKGIIYQAACASCGQASSFPATAGAYSTVKPAQASCNMAALKYDLVTLIADADVDGPLEACINDSIQFVNESFGGSVYFWDFGDGNTSDAFEPRHAYTNAGTYDVVLIIQDSVSCIFSDTDSIQLVINPGPMAMVPDFARVCKGEQIQLMASGGETYSWAPSTGLSNPNIANPIATVDQLRTYVVTVGDSCGTDTAWVTLRPFPEIASAITDTTLCKGLSGRLWADGGKSYTWSPPFYLSSTSAARPLVTPDTTTEYTVTIVDSFDCVSQFPVTVFVEGAIPEVYASGDTVICGGERVLLNATGATDYEWFPKENVISPFLPVTPVFPETTTWYRVQVTNSCGTVMDSVLIEVKPNSLFVSPDTAVCFGDTVSLLATGSLAYRWYGESIESPFFTPNPSFVPQESQWIYVEGRNLENCKRNDSIWIDVLPNPTLEIDFNPDTVTGLHNVKLVARSNGYLKWESKGFIPCFTCDTLIVFPKQSTVYKVMAYDSNGCILSDSVEVKAISKLHIPNAFTPNGDGINDVFAISKFNVSAFSIEIRNRWGELIFESKDIERSWNGTKFNSGEIQPIGSYTYTIRYTVTPGQELVETGLVNLVR